MRRIPCLLAVAAGGGLATIVFLWGTAVPLGVPGEWVWERIPLADLGGSLIAGALVALVGAVYVAFVARGASRFGTRINATTMADHPVRETSVLARSAWLSGLVVTGFVWLFAVQSLPPMPYGLSKSSHVLFSPGSSGYFFEARHGGWTTAEFLASYEGRMREGDVLHVGTHPPGLFLTNRWLLDFFEASPAAAESVAGTRPSAVREVDEALLPRMGAGRPTTADVATLWTVTLLTHLFAVLTCVPLFLLVRRTSSARSAWWAAAFWPLVPGLAIFLPKSDALYPFIGMLFLWLWLEAVRRGSARWAAAAGLVVWFGLWFSLALLPVGLLALVVAVGETWILDERRWRDLIVAGAVALVAMSAATLATWLVADLDLLTVWWLNLGNHAEFYERFSRTYAAWLFVNPVELVLALGWPVALLGGFGVVRAAARTRASAPEPLPGHDGGRLVVFAALGVWALLWLSGKNMGEAGRLWLFLAPWPLWGAFALPREPTSFDRSAVWLLAMQLVVYAATVARVNGFPLPG
jgi:methylthioxylose transferase